MQRFLLFDSGCSICSDLAREIEHQSSGWMVARSLHDAEMQAILDHHRMGWRWEPTLLEIGDSRVRVYTGLAMRGRILMGLGAQRTWRVSQLLRRFGVPLSGMHLGRRDFFRQVGMVFGGLAIFGLPKWQFNQGSTNAPNVSSNMEGELYAGFVLLPEGAPVPDFVQPSRLGIPIVCGVGAGRGGPSVKAIIKSFGTPAALKRAIGFPMYTFGQLPKRLRPAGGYLVQHESGEVFGSSLHFEAFNAQINTWDSCVTIWAEPDFSRPFPLWSSNAVEPGGPAVILEKVDFLPTPGIMIKTQAGYFFHWIQSDVLYAMRAEYNAPFKEVKALATALVTTN